MIVLIWKGKGDIHDPGRYRGIALLSQALKLIERMLDARVRHIVERKIGEKQLGFRKGRGTDDGLLAIRQIITKRREFRKYVAFGFIDLEKAFDTMLRELAFAVVSRAGVNSFQSIPIPLQFLFIQFQFQFIFFFQFFLVIPIPFKIVQFQFPLLLQFHITTKVNNERLMCM